MTYDLIIIGAGPAGLTAAIYSIRYRMKVLVIGKLPGGTATRAYQIWNFPSHKKILGTELMIKIMNQVKELGVKIIPNNVRDIKKTKKGFEVYTRTENFVTKNIILATGTERKRLGIGKEEEFVGKGVNYCATCDAPLYKNKTVAVVGGCNAALNTAELLTEFAKKVYLIHKGKDFCEAGKIDSEKVMENKKVEIILNQRIIKLKGKTNLSGIKLSSGRILKVHGLFIEIGSVPSIVLAKKLKIKTSKGKILVNKEQKTNIPGVFAAGDVTDTPLNQIITACGEGAVAAHSAHKNLKK